jgi:Tol biopolymer transport system component
LSSQNADGSGRRVLASGHASSLAPDGSQVAVLDYDQGPVQPTNFRIKLVASSGGRPSHVLNVDCGAAWSRGVAWSPDSRQLACVDSDRTADGVGRLLLIDAATAASTTLTQGFIDGDVSFSPDGTQLAYVQRTGPNSIGGNLKRIDIATRAIATVRNGTFVAPLWGPTAIAVSTVSSRRPNAGLGLNVAVVQPGGGGFRQLTHVRRHFLLAGLVPVAWSADGTRLLGGLGGQDAWLAYAIDPIRGGSRRIGKWFAPSALSRDGRYVIGDTTAGQDFGPRGANVVRVPWGGGKARVLLHNAMAPSFNG